MKPCFPRNGWTSAFQLEVVHKFLVLLYLWVQLLLYLLNCLYLIPWVFSRSSFRFSPQSCLGRVSKQLWDASCLLGLTHKKSSSGKTCTAWNSLWVLGLVLGSGCAFRNLHLNPSFYGFFSQLTITDAEDLWEESERMWGKAKNFLHKKATLVIQEERDCSEREIGLDDLQKSPSKLNFSVIPYVIEWLNYFSWKMAWMKKWHENMLGKNELFMF